MSNKQIEAAHLSGRTQEARDRERRKKNKLRKITITVRQNTAYHLAQMAAVCGGNRDMGRAVDKLVREHQLSLRPFQEDAYAERTD